MKKPVKSKLIFSIISAAIGVAIDIAIHTLLSEDKSWHEHEQTLWVVLLVCWLLTFLFFEWTFFKFFEWIPFSEELNEKLTFTDNVFNLINEFAEANFLMKKMIKTVKDDLYLEGKLKESLLKIKDKSLFISKLKYELYLSSHFISSGDEKVIRQIPVYYFTHKIWKKFVDESSCYYSLQLLDMHQSKEYLSNPERLDSELNFLYSKLRGKNKTILKKVFVLESDLFENGKLKPGEIKKYLNEWKEMFQNYKSDFPIKIIEKKRAGGLIDTGQKLNDIGIFGEVYGIQSLNSPKTEEFYTDNLKIDFYFDEKETDKQKKSFEKLFKSEHAKDLSSFF